MSEFVFLYRGGDRSGSPEQMQQILQKWMAWFKGFGGHRSSQGPRPTAGTHR
jgi:hypothetical protein